MNIQQLMKAQQAAMWKVYITVEGTEKLIYNGRWMPTVDDMSVVRQVRGHQYRVVSPDGRDVTKHFPYGIET